MNYNNFFEYVLKKSSNERGIFEIESKKFSSYTEIINNALLIGNSLYAYDQKVISVILPNSINYIECFLACIATNNIFNPIPYFIEPQELEKTLTYVNPELIISDRKDIDSDFKLIHPQLFLDNKSKITPKKNEIHDVASLYYSSGTTGNPKGVLYSHKNMISLIESIMNGFKFNSSDNQLAFLPFGHTASINYNILPSLMVGSNLFISQGFEFLRGNFFEVLEKYQISYTQIVPTVLHMLIKLKIDISSIDLSNLRFIGCGSSTLPLVSQEEFMDLYKIKLANLYGLSETGPSHIDYPLHKNWIPGSIGKPLDVNDCQISKSGEILLKGDNIFIGYHKNEALYRETVIDGWFKTGDLGYKKDDKYFFVDRKKDLIIKGAINIVPMEIEEVIYTHPAVHECVVVGKNSKIFGEEIVAVIVAKNVIDFLKIKKDIKVLCKTKLSNYKVPSKILFWDELPKTLSNKLLRRKVRELVNKS
jgi:acyl-CoA synthetase (AMP-forming)/AMP-acid ligase II